MPTQYFRVSITAGKRTPARVSVHWAGNPRDLTLVNGETFTAAQASEMVRHELQGAMNEREQADNEMGAADVWPIQTRTVPVRRRRRED